MSLLVDTRMLLTFWDIVPGALLFVASAIPPLLPSPPHYVIFTADYQVKMKHCPGFYLLFNLLLTKPEWDRSYSQHENTGNWGLKSSVSCLRSHVIKNRGNSEFQVWNPCLSTPIHFLKVRIFLLWGPPLFPLAEVLWQKTFDWNLQFPTRWGQDRYNIENII